MFARFGRGEQSLLCVPCLTDEALAVVRATGLGNCCQPNQGQTRIIESHSLKVIPAGYSPLVSVYYSPSLTNRIYIFRHAIAQSINQICNFFLICFLLPAILFPLISFPLPTYVSLRK